MSPSVDISSTVVADPVAAENLKSVKVLDELLGKLNLSKSSDDANAAALNLAQFINGPIEEHDAPTK